MKAQLVCIPAASYRILYMHLVDCTLVQDMFLCTESCLSNIVDFQDSASPVPLAGVAQLVRALDCGSKGPGFDPPPRYHSKYLKALGLQESPCQFVRQKP